jgi:hypothetical protein
MKREQHVGDLEWDRLVSEGRDPEWRISWEEHLSREERQSVLAAVKSGRPVREENLRKYAAGYARRSLRSNRWRFGLIPVNVAVVALWIYLECFRHTSASLPCWFWVVGGFLWLFLLPAWLIIQRRQILRAQEANVPFDQPAR